LVGTGGNYPPVTRDGLLAGLVSSGRGPRELSFGGAVLVLALFAPFLARRRCAVPYFIILTLCALTLTQAPTPLHWLLYLIPRFQEQHEHEPFHALVMAPIGFAVLVGATVDRAIALRGHRRLLLTVPLVVAAAGTVAV